MTDPDFMRAAAGLTELAATLETMAHDAWHVADSERSSRYQEIAAAVRPAVAHLYVAAAQQAENTAMDGMLKAVLAQMHSEHGPDAVASILDDLDDYENERDWPDGVQPADSVAAVDKVRALRRFLHLPGAQDDDLRLL